MQTIAKTGVKVVTKAPRTSAQSESIITLDRRISMQKPVSSPSSRPTSGKLHHPLYKLCMVPAHIPL
ncbi:hypothetical protein Mapa_006856 [Marchantia paleacea]|nr:hypothetical protein Mapa_006856 [Marchantia paleacea]